MTTDPYSYDPKLFFNSFYKTMGVANWITDRQTVGELDPRFIRHHYNSLENLILESLGTRDEQKVLRVLDFGAGAGHWTDFALNVLGADRAEVVDVSSTAREHLRSKYAATFGIRVYDTLYQTFTHKFEVVFAIGVMFHIVKDEMWETTLHRLIERLAPGGRLFVTDLFHQETKDVQFHYTDDFSNWYDFNNPGSGRAKMVNKRLRDVREWDRLVREAGAKVEHLWFNRAPAGYITPENSLMVVKKEGE